MKTYLNKVNRSMSAIVGEQVTNRDICYTCIGLVCFLSLLSILSTIG